MSPIGWRRTAACGKTVSIGSTRTCSRHPDPRRKESAMAMPVETAVFEIARRYAQPLATVWRAWSDAEALACWWGPKGCTIGVERLEFRPGGFFHYRMTFPGAAPMWGRFNYREIVAHERLVWLNSFANERCGIARAPF